MYQNIKYTSVDELKQLLNKLETNKKYYMKVNYDRKYDYIETITLSLYDNEIFRKLLTYEGDNKSVSSVKALINYVLSEVDSNHYEGIKINIIYISNTQQAPIVNISTDTSQEIEDLLKEIKGNNRYTVEIQNDSDYIYNIIITCNR